MQIKLICEYCGKEFVRIKGEANRNKKLGRRTYCSLKCTGSDNNAHLDEHKGKWHNKFVRQVDEYSPFRYFLNIIKQHSKGNRASNRRRNMEIAITFQDLKNQWEKQKGICPYTGWKLKSPKSLSPRHQLSKTPDRASLDRIDSSKGYVLGNIQFVSLMAQYAKLDWSGKDLINFCEAVSSYNQKQVF